METTEATAGPSHASGSRDYYTITVRNEYGILDEENEDSNPVDLEAERDLAEEEALEQLTIERLRMPPIVIQAAKIHDFAAFRRRVNKICISEFRIAYRSDTVSVFTYCRDDHLNLFNDLKMGQISAYSHKHKKDKRQLYVLKDLPRGLSMDEVTAGVTEWIDIKDLTVTPMHKRRVDFEEGHYPYYIVHLQNSTGFQGPLGKAQFKGQSNSVSSLPAIRAWR